MAITLRDIAERTGVSPSVVSTVLSGRENGTFVSKDTRLRVLEVAKQLNYVPVRSGRPRGSRRLRRMHTEQFVGVWSPSTDRAALGAVANVHNAVLEFAANDPAIEEGVTLGLRLISDTELPRLDTLGLMGLVIIGDTPLPRAAAAASIPCVQLGEPDHANRECFTIHLDGFAAGQTIANYLWRLGHRTLAFAAPASKPRVTRNRWQGMHSVWIGENGAPQTACIPAPYDVERSLSMREQVEGAIHKLYAGTSQRPSPSPTALVCFDETVTAYVLQALNKIGKKVPDDVSIATFGDSMGGADAMSPPVTSIKLSSEVLAKAAVHELYQRVLSVAAGKADQDPKRETKFIGELVIRDSCAVPPAG
jgi:DNA-binding LacI/PurR family transcriptional regulator